MREHPEPASEPPFGDPDAPPPLSDWRRDKEMKDEDGVADAVDTAFDDVERAMENRIRRADMIRRNWEMFHCVLSEDQVYTGPSNFYVPLARDAVNARKIRFTNQLFPRSERYVTALTETGELPSDIISLLEHYVRKAHLRTDIVPALMLNGDLEGHYTVYVTWRATKRATVKREEVPLPLVDPETMQPVVTMQAIDVVVQDAGPVVEVIPDNDLIVTPSTANSLGDALDQGGCVAIVRRWTKAKLRQMMETGEVEEEAGEEALGLFGDVATRSALWTRVQDTRVEQLESAGIHDDSTESYLLLYEIWLNLNIDDEMRLYRCFHAGKGHILSVKRNPLWSDRLPILSAPRERAAGVFKGRAPVDAVYDFQLAANDAINIGMDSAHRGLQVVVMTDPEKNPNVDCMTQSPGALWLTSPQDTQPLQIPVMWEEALSIVNAARMQVMQTLGVNPAMITQSTSTAKRNQAEMAQEQAVDLLTTAEAVVTIEENILSPMLQLFLELDYQFRDHNLLVPTIADLGPKPKLVSVPPVELESSYYFMWFGVEAVKNSERVQLQVAALNVLRGIPPAMYPEHRMNIAPAVSVLLEDAFGPRLAPLIFEKLADLPPEVAQLEMMKKQAPGGMPGAPGGAGPGAPGQPAPGAAPGGQRAANPPGSIGKDQMKEAGVAPRAQRGGEDGSYR